MTRQQAYKRAQRLAARTQEHVMIIYVPEDRNYDVATDYDLDTFYHGISDDHILASISPDGEIGGTL